MPRFWLPTRPYSLIDAINRYAAATGSPRYAAAASGANYNGHMVSVYFNDYRKYWLCEHYWGERVVHSRGGCQQALLAGKREYDMGHLGTCVITVDLTNPEDVAYAESLGYQLYTEEIAKAHTTTWRDARFDEINNAFFWEKNGLGPAVGLLANSTSLEDYKTQLEASKASRRTYR